MLWLKSMTTARRSTRSRHTYKLSCFVSLGCGRFDKNRMDIEKLNLRQSIQNFTWWHPSEGFIKLKQFFSDLLEIMITEVWIVDCKSPCVCDQYILMCATYKNLQNLCWALPFFLFAFTTIQCYCCVCMYSLSLTISDWVYLRHYWIIY